MLEQHCNRQHSKKKIGENMVQDETTILKAEIFDIIQKQEEQTSIVNTLQQTKLQKLQELKNIGQKTADDIIKVKADIFDIMQEQEKYIAVVNELQQAKSQKLQKLQSVKNIQMQQ
jgi:hypothetical protein